MRMTIRFTGIDHVQLAAPAGCEAEARRFYGGVLGWEELPKPASLQARGGAWFRCGMHEVHIGVQADFRPAKKAHPGFAMFGLDELRNRLVEAGVPVTDDALREDEGLQRLFAEDPFGNRLEFLQYDRDGVTTMSKEEKSDEQPE
jgi:catechol 2,3-dioxygenase-like lactoylglutathione lyase family enzyme